MMYLRFGLFELKSKISVVRMDHKHFTAHWIDQAGIKKMIKMAGGGQEYRSRMICPRSIYGIMLTRVSPTS